MYVRKANMLTQDTRLGLHQICLKNNPLWNDYSDRKIYFTLPTQYAQRWINTNS